MRIGNLFERDGNILEVVRISKDGAINYEIVEKSKGQHVNGGVVRPIPLTEEWLLRFGFKRFPWGLVKDNLLFKDDLKCTYLILQVGNGFEVKVSCVHELQNLYFALTNNELVCTSK